MQNVTKMKLIACHFALIFSLNPAFAQTRAGHFKSDLDFGSGTVISTFLDVSITHNQFTITSPKNADVRMMSPGKARLGRLLGQLPKKGIIVTIKGVQKQDSLFGEAKIPMFGRLKFKGIVQDETLTGELLNKDGETIGTLEGKNSMEDRISYTELCHKAITTIQDNIYSKSAVQTKEWRRFEKGFKKLSKHAHDDIEIFFGFSMLARKLPFTHLYLLIGRDSAGTGETVSTRKSVIFEEKNSTTAYLRIRNFSSSQEELAGILPKIAGNPAFRHLIIDLRDNGGGGVGPAFELAKYIVTEDMEVGYFPTNKLNYSGYQPELFKTLPVLQPKSTEELGKELRTSPGVRLIFKKPANPVFTGSIYVLTNGNTGSTCEPMVYAFKKSKRAVIIGEKTAGAMLAASPFVVAGKYMLMLPVADFYTYDGARLDKRGVEPDVKVTSEEAEKKALELIQETKDEK